MRGQPLQFDRKPWQERIITQLRAFLGVQEHPHVLHDMLADLRTRLANQDAILQKLVMAAQVPPLSAATPSDTLSTPTAFEISDDINTPPIINGKIKPKLTVSQHDIVMELVKAGPGGLSLEELDAKSGHPEARKALKKLARDADWKSVIIFPGKKGQGGYRLRFS